MNSHVSSKDFYELCRNPLCIEISRNAPFYEELYNIFKNNRINEKGKPDIILPSHATYVVKFAEDFLQENYDVFLKNNEDITSFVNLKKFIFSNFDNNLLNV